MRVLIALFVCMLLGACQHRNATQKKVKNINYPQLQSYLTQKDQTLLWSSRSRIQALGGRIPSQPPAPTFGLPFSEAKKLAMVVDVRPAELFDHANLTMRPETKIPVVNIPWLELQDKPPPELPDYLRQKGVGKNSILIVICNQGVTSPKAATYLYDHGYTRVLNYPGGYSSLPSCAE